VDAVYRWGTGTASGSRALLLIAAARPHNACALTQATYCPAH
jgi:hypothetical protein